MTPKERVLKFDRSDADSEHTYILVNARSKGSKSLDVKLEAIDFESCFVTSLKHDKVSSLRVKNCSASESDWRVILEKLFNQEFQPEIQATASVSEGSIALVIRKSVQGITQRLGTINIPGTEDQFNYLEWAGTAVDAVVETKKTAAEATTKVEQLEAEVKDLKSQLEELIQAKDDDEKTMLLKFRDLLNEKKVKIREQQKIIASTRTDAGTNSSQTPQPPQQTSPQLPQTSLPSRGRKAAQSRSSKRKQPAAVVEESSDEDAEPMDVDKVKEEEETDKGMETDGATASTASDEEDEAPAQNANATNAATSLQQQTPLSKKPQGQPPPKRALPFTKAKSKASEASRQATGDSETESDDEL